MSSGPDAGVSDNDQDDETFSHSLFYIAWEKKWEHVTKPLQTSVGD